VRRSRRTRSSRVSRCRRAGHAIVDPDELAPFVPLPTKTIDVQEFVDLAETDPIYFETSYYVAPHLNSNPYAWLARALAPSGKVAIVRFVMRNGRYTSAIRAESSNLIMSTLVYADAVVPLAEVEELTRLGGVAVADREVKWPRCSSSHRLTPSRELECRDGRAIQAGRRLRPGVRRRPG
jgi:Ku70/Ku80 beta-barrel domain